MSNVPLGIMTQKGAAAPPARGGGPSFFADNLVNLVNLANLVSLVYLANLVNLVYLANLVNLR